MLTHDIHVKTGTYGIQPVIHAVEGETGRFINIYTDDRAVTSSEEAELSIHRPDDSYYTDDHATVMPDSGEGQGFYNFSLVQALTRPGRVECQLKISSNGLILSTYTFYIVVEPSANGIPVAQLGYDIYDLIDAAQQIQNVGLTEEIKQALLDCFEHVAWTDEHGQDYVDALEAALYPPATLVSISAVYTQSGTVYTTDSLDDLKSDLVVTAIYTDSTSETVTNYTLSGTLTEGTSVITVSYGGKTTTFNVTVTAPATLSSITAVYTQSGTVYDTDSLDSLKADLVVTAVYSDSTTQTVASTDYTLSGTLTVGTSTITVSYGGKTTTFTVTVTEHTIPALYNWDLKSSLTDTVGGITATTNATFTSGTGLVFDAGNQYCDFGAVYALNRTYELDVVSHEHVNFGEYARLFAVNTNNQTASGGCAFVFTGSKRIQQNPTGYGMYTGSAWDTQVFANIGEATQANDYNDGFFNGKTIKFYVASDGKCSVSYKTTGASDSTYTFIGTSATAFNGYTNAHVYIGSSNWEDARNLVVSGLRVYEGEV